MCWFITIGVGPKGASTVEALGRERAGLGVRPSKNSSLAAVFPSSDVRFEITHGGCSCDLWLGGRDDSAARSEKMRRRYRAEGWSEAKIARALSAAEGARTASAHRRDNSDARLLFKKVVTDQVNRLGSVRLIAHFYSGSQDDEHVACADRRRITSEEFLRGELPEDVLVEVAVSRLTSR